MSEIRLDRINNQYVLIAPERLHRPNLGNVYQKKRDVTCPFCEGNEELTPTEIFSLKNDVPDGASWKTRVVPNLYKAVQVELEYYSKIEGMFESIAGVGAHEILIDSPCHDCTMTDLKASNIEDWLRTIIIRIDDLKRDERLIYLSIFKNFGLNAGATQDHPHTQLLALPIMPKNEIIFLQRNFEYYKKHGRGLIEDIVQNEMFSKERVIDKVGSFVAFCPYASAYPFEVMIAPTKNIANLSHCSRKEVIDLSIIIKNVFDMLESQLGRFDYNMYFSLAPLNSNFENEHYMPYLNKNYRFSLRIAPKIYRLGGFETATGMLINSVLPEESADLLRGRTR